MGKQLLLTLVSARAHGKDQHMSVTPTNQAV